MKWTLAIILVVATVVLIGAGLLQARESGGTVGIAAGSALPGFAAAPDTPEHALTLLLTDLERRNWSQAFSLISQTSDVPEPAFIEDWNGRSGGLRTFSSLEGFDLWPLHASPDDAQIRAHLRWTTPVGAVQDVRDFSLRREENLWRIVWPKVQSADVPAQVVPSTYLRWDLVIGTANDAWGSHNVDAPHVRIVSMNAIDTAKGTVIAGEVENEDTIPAFVNVNATLVDEAGRALDEENSFDKIAHVLLPSQVSPYRIDFPGITLEKVKNVHMDVKTALVPASADPVIGVIDQKIDQDAQGNPVLRGEVQNQSGETVNIPHVIAGFYDGNGRVVWVGDGYVDRALLPLSAEPFSIEIPHSLAGKVHGFHVVVNQYSLGGS